MESYLSKVGDAVPAGTWKDELARGDLRKEVFIRHASTTHDISDKSLNK